MVVAKNILFKTYIAFIPYVTYIDNNRYRG